MRCWVEKPSMKFFITDSPSKQRYHSCFLLPVNDYRTVFYTSLAAYNLRSVERLEKNCTVRVEWAAKPILNCHGVNMCLHHKYIHPSHQQSYRIHATCNRKLSHMSSAIDTVRSPSMLT